MDKYAVFGNPIAQSKSPQIHMLFASQTQQAMHYGKQLVELGEFSAAAKTFFEGGGLGLNVTAPFKEDAFAYADMLTKRAEMAGAVNTLLKQKDGTILGDNTDGAGLVSDICQRLQWVLQNRRVLVLGAGGAVRGVLLPLLDQLPDTLVVANRTLHKAETLVARFDAPSVLRAISFEALANEAPFNVVINATSAGLSGSIPAIGNECLTDATCVYDMVYGSEPTAFLRWAAEQGVTEYADGLGMLVGQAAESFELWRQKRPEVQAVIEELRQPN